MEYKDKLLKSWEEVYKKGQLTLWILLSLKDNSKYVEEIKQFIEEKTKGTFTSEEQSLYRSLRKLYQIEIVDYNMQKGNKGPERKYYKLTKIGGELLKEFVQRNIYLFFDEKVKKLLTI